MHPDWKQHLATGVDEGLVAPSGEAVLLDLTAEHGLLRASGADAAAFLNGQLTNDVRRLPVGGSALAGYCTPQGRLLAVARVFRWRDDYYLRLPLELCDDVLARLRRFILRAKVVLEPADAALVLFGLAGPLAPAMLAEAIGAPAPSETEPFVSDSACVARITGPRERFELVAPVDRAKVLWNELRSRGARPIPGHWWDWFDIEAGVPTVYRATQEKFIPQTTNLELVGGVSFEKGCYPGQEIVARVHYLGRPKERMYRLHLAGDAAVQPGDPVYAPDLPGQATGNVVRAHAAPDGGVDLLAVVHVTSAEGAELRWRTPDGPRLEWRALPYALPQTRS